MIVLVDTNIIIDALRVKNAGASPLSDLLRNGATLSVSAVTVGEVYVGLREAETSATGALLARMECYPVTRAIAWRGGLLVNDWARNGRTFTLDDMLIAATVLEHDLTLLTANRKDFPMRELKLYPPGPKPLIRT